MVAISLCSDEFWQTCQTLLSFAYVTRRKGEMLTRQPVAHRLVVLAIFPAFRNWRGWIVRKRRNPYHQLWRPIFVQVLLDEKDRQECRPHLYRHLTGKRIEKDKFCPFQQFYCYNFAFRHPALFIIVRFGFLISFVQIFSRIINGMNIYIYYICISARDVLSNIKLTTLVILLTRTLVVRYVQMPNNEIHFKRHLI